MYSKIVRNCYINDKTKNNKFTQILTICKWNLKSGTLLEKGGELIFMYNKLVKTAFTGVIAQAESEEEKEVVIYGLEAIVSTIVDLFFILIIGYISHNTLGTIIYLFCFCTIRVLAGGYHANSYLSCLLCSIISYSFIVLVNPYLTQQYNMALIIMTVISYVVILIVAPVLNGKRAFAEDEVARIKKKVRIILTIELLVTIVLYFINFELYKFAIYAMITEGVFGIMGKIKYLSLNKKALLKKMMNLSLGVALLSGGFPCLIVFHEPQVPKALREKLERK